MPVRSTVRTIVRPTLRTIGNGTPIGSGGGTWLLADGTWNDEGVWLDSATWPVEFSPTDISDLAQWLDASDSATVLNSIGPDVAATNDQTVRRWLDKSGNDRHFDQTAGLEQALFKTNQINGKSVLDFDSVNDGMTSSFALNAPYTIMLIARQRSAAVRILNSTGTNSLMSLSRSSFCVYVNDSMVRNAAIVATETLAAAFLHCPAIAAGNMRLYLNSSTTNLATSIRAAANWGTLTIGNEGTNPTPADSLLCEIAIYSRDLTEEERLQLAAYATSKWGTPE